MSREHLGSHPTKPDGDLPPEIDEQIGKGLVSAFVKFITFRSINPGWYAAHLGETRLAEALAPGV